MCRTITSLLSSAICATQMVVRVVMTITLMMENLIRLILQTVYNFVSFVLQLISLLPICCVFLITSRLKCFMCGGGGPCPVNRGGGCDCLMSLIAVIILFFIFRATGILDKIFYSMGYAKAPTDVLRFIPTPGDVTECSRNDTEITEYELDYETTAAMAANDSKSEDSADSGQTKVSGGDGDSGIGGGDSTGSVPGGDKGDVTIDGGPGGEGEPGGEGGPGGDVTTEHGGEEHVGEEPGADAQDTEVSKGIDPDGEGTDEKVTTSESPDEKESSGQGPDEKDPSESHDEKDPGESHDEKDPGEGPGSERKGSHGTSVTTPKLQRFQLVREPKLTITVIEEIELNDSVTKPMLSRKRRTPDFKHIVSEVMEYIN